MTQLVHIPRRRLGASAHSLGHRHGAMGLSHAVSCVRATTRQRPKYPAARVGPVRRTTMKIARSGSQPSGRGPAEWFTGTVRIDPLFGAEAPARAAGNAVTFEPG